MLTALLLVGVGLACRLTEATPASWSGTPSAEAREATNRAFESTQQAQLEKTPMIPPATSSPIPATVTPVPTVPADGPWLVFPAMTGSALLAYDVDAHSLQTIVLPEPLYGSDLVTGRAPDGQTLIIRAGSPLNTDELALYEVDLMAGTVMKVSPLLSIANQRKLVNEQGSRVFDTLEAVTRADSLAWSPNGRYLAFTAALDNNSADLYVWNIEKSRVDRLNGIYSQSASPFWAPGSNWLITQEMEMDAASTGWRTEVVSGLHMPGYDGQNTLYLPANGSRYEVFVGWINAQTFISYSQTDEGAIMLRQVNVETLSRDVILAESFQAVASDPGSGVLALTLDEAQAARQGLIAGIYLLKPDRGVLELQLAGIWPSLTWDRGGMFLASGQQGLYVFNAEGRGVMLPEENGGRLSPNGSWMVAWGDSEQGEPGLRLYQGLSGNNLQEITDLPVESVLWQPDSKAFFMLAEGVLYHVAFPGLKLEPVESGFALDQTLEMIWME